MQRTWKRRRCSSDLPWIFLAFASGLERRVPFSDLPSQSSFCCSTQKGSGARASPQAARSRGGSGPAVGPGQCSSSRTCRPDWLQQAAPYITLISPSPRADQLVGVRTVRRVSRGRSRLCISHFPFLLPIARARSGFLLGSSLLLRSIRLGLPRFAAVSPGHLVVVHLLHRACATPTCRPSRSLRPPACPSVRPTFLCPFESARLLLGRGQSPDPVFLFAFPLSTARWSLHSWGANRHVLLLPIVGQSSPESCHKYGSSSTGTNLLCCRARIWTST